MEIEQPPPQIRSTPYQSPMQLYGSSILYLTNPEQELFKLELTLRGQTIDKDGNVKQIAENPLMNEKGISSVIGALQAVVNQVTVMSTLDKKEIPALMTFLSDTIARDLMINAQSYNLNPHDRDKVFFNIVTSAFICMKRATNEGLSDKKFWRGSVQEITSKVEGSQKRGGLLGLIGWKK